MLNSIFLGLIVIAIVVASFNGKMADVGMASLSSAKGAVELALGLIGQMALWMGFMRILQDGGLMRAIARSLRPVMTRVFPDVPPEHPAMGAMIMNLAANVVGLANAATPFGLKAMKELDKLNQHKGVATNAMALFLAINTSGVAVLPLGVMAVRATLGAKNIAGVVIPTLLATMCNTIVAVIVAKLLEKLPVFSVARAMTTGAGAVTVAASGSDPAPEEKAPDYAKIEETNAPRVPWSRARLSIALLIAAVISFGLFNQMRTTESADVLMTLKVIIEGWLLPVLMLSIVLFGFSKRIKIYESFITGAKEGFQTCVSIIPFLVAILVAIAMFRASGAMDTIVAAIGPVTNALGIPAETLPMAMIRSLSGSGALAVMTETMKTYGPDSFVGFVVSVMNGAHDTTFYVLAVYYGSVQVRATRHTVGACLAADAVGILGAVYFSHLFF